MMNLLHCLGFTAFADAVADDDAVAFEIDSLCPDSFAAPGTDAFQIHGSPPQIKKPPWLENQRGPVIGYSCQTKRK